LSVRRSLIEHLLELDFYALRNSFLSPLGFSANEFPGINTQASEQRITNFRIPIEMKGDLSV